MTYDSIRPDIVTAIRRYADEHCPVGGFLTAVLSNDLREAFRRADDDNRAGLGAIVAYCWWEIPGDCWGSPERVRAWLEARPAESKESR